MLKIPNVTYWIQSVNLPGLSATPKSFDNPFTRIHLVPETIEFEPLTLSFLLDEDMVSWQEIWDWMVAYGFPENFGQYAGRTTDSASLRPDSGDLYSDGTLMLTTNNKNYNKQIIFKDLFPTSLSALDFSSADQEASPFVATATFHYTTYRLENVNEPAVPLSGLDHTVGGKPMQPAEW
jgi:hypothetical protein